MLVSDFVVQLNVMLSVCWPGCEGVCVCWTYTYQNVFIYMEREFILGDRMYVGPKCPTQLDVELLSGGRNV